MHNGVMIQAFEWFMPDDGQHYRRLVECTAQWRALGVTGVWLPPATKATGSNDVGYGVYDLYDLGAYDQKGTVRTKYGTFEELREAIRSLQAAGMQVYADAVLNHKAGADFAETTMAVKVDPTNRLRDLGEPHEIEAWTGFNFPGRGGELSSFEWHWQHFTGVDYDQRSGENGIYRIVGENKYWADEVSQSRGNYDYLMFADIDHRHPDVREELKRWADWYIAETGVNGFRIDAAKHIDASFIRELVAHVEDGHDNEIYFVAEYWENSDETLETYLEQTDHQLALFDVVLHFRLYEASKSGDAYDLRTIFDGTAVQRDPMHVVTFVDNHDSQPGQALESTVEPWFKPLAYALILLRRDGYPCVFWGDLYGSGDGKLPSHEPLLTRLLQLRRRFALGQQDEYFDDERAIGWVRREGEGQASPLAVLLTNRGPAERRMFVGEAWAGRHFVDGLGIAEGQVRIDDEGYGMFYVGGGQVSAWVEAEALEALDSEAEA